ncbi:hypothetical protein BGX27_011429 [Mortierella sp. AM989]|nr:hypothetical protein BGX27_011429 [Mortierella sp. AM989]
MAPPPRSRTRSKKLPPGAGATAAARKANAVEKLPHVLDPENESEGEVGMEVDQETADAKAWIKENVEQEATRIRSTGTNIEPLTVKNFGVVVDLSRKKASAINRIEINSSFDFKNIQQIMVSPGIPYPHKENFEYVNVLLFGESAATPMLVPYLYDTKFKTQEPVEGDNIANPTSTSPVGSADQRPWISVKNNLTDWLLTLETGTIMDPRKLKVNELKEQLQLVGLSVNGKKEELVARLLEHQKAEEEAVNADGPPTGTGDTFEWDESKFDIDDLAPPSDPAPSATVKPITSVQASKPAVSVIPSSTASSATKPATPVAAASTKAASNANAPAAASISPSVSGSSNSTAATGSIQFQGATKDAETLKAEFEKRKNRAARFGIPLKEQDKAVERAARFGVPVTATATASLAKATGTSASPKPVPAKSGSITAQIPADVLNKRRERFGNQTSESTTTSAGSPGTGAVKKSSLVLDAAEEEKKRKRAAKFGLAPADTNEANKKIKP